MAILNQSQTRERKDFHQECFVPGTLTALKARTDSVTIFRPIPEFDAQGNLLPMVKTMTAAGPDFSNTAIEEIVVNTGGSVKYSGMCRASDSDATEAINMVFPSLYIKLTARLKRGEIPDDMRAKVAALLEQKDVPGGKSKIKHRLLERSQQVGFMQGIALTVNGKALEKPAVRQVLIMSVNMCKIMSSVLGKAFTEQKLDVFHPKTGCVLIIRGLPADTTQGRTIPIHTVEIGKNTPIREDTAKGLWVPWESAFKRITTDQQILYAIRCFGRDVVSLVYPDDVARLTAPAAQAVQVKPAVAQATAAQTAPASPPVTPDGELDLSGATSGQVDDGAGEDEGEGVSETLSTAPTSPGKPATPEDLAGDYANVLGKI